MGYSCKKYLIAKEEINDLVEILAYVMIGLRYVGVRQKYLLVNFVTKIIYSIFIVWVISDSVIGMFKCLVNILA